MSDVRSFLLRSGEFREQDEAALSAFLKSVNERRVETAHDAEGWHVLVFFEDLRRKEESAQIEMAIVAALNAWRTRKAEELGAERLAILPDSLMADIAHYAPTTAVELRVVASSSECDLSVSGEEIVRVVRETLEALTGE